MTVSSGISSPEDQAGAADRTPPESWGESLYQATMQVLDAPEQGGSVLGKLGLLIGTLALSVLVFLWLGLPLLFLLILLLVIVFHELGHYIGMWIFGYRDLRMFFIPFFGAAVSGVKYGVPVWQQATVLLLGPLRLQSTSKPLSRSKRSSLPPRPLASPCWRWAIRTLVRLLLPPAAVRKP